HQPRGDHAQAVRAELADVLLAQGASAAAWEEARRVRLGLLAGGERARAARLVAELARAHGDRRAAAAALAWLPDDAAPAAEIARALAELPTTSVLALAEALGGRPAAAPVWLEIGERAVREGDRSLAIRALARAQRATLSAADQARHDRVAQLLEGGARF